MKKVFIVLGLPLFLFLILPSAGCRENSKGNRSDTTNVKVGNAEISFNTLEHDFGKITAGEKVAYIFGFENTGTTDLVIATATTSCGCTVPEFDKKPIPPDGKGTMEVVFDSSGFSGKQSKTITVRSNAAKQVVILKITAEVITINN
jgi:hypothetical protein